jgi:arsenical pump membrane protein
MLVAIVHLLVCIILLAVSDIICVEMWLICLTLALSLTIFDIVYDFLLIHSAKPVWHSIKKEPYELIPFVLSMFIIVLALKENGVTDALGSILLGNNNTDGISFGFISALSANLLNNIPMSVLFEKIINGSSTSAVFGAVIGSNIGAFITPVGALAGIMWTKILSKYNLKLSFVKFLLYGSAVAIPTLIASTLGLYIILL